MSTDRKYPRRRFFSLPVVLTALALTGASVACGGDNPPPPPPPPPGTGVANPGQAGVVPTAPVPMPGAQPVGQPVAAPTPTPVPAPPSGVPGTSAPATSPPASAGTSNYGTLSVQPGFTPDPMITRGISGGPTSASTLADSCRGYISTTPDHLLVAGGTFNLMQIAVNGGAADTTLVVRKPDGTYLCDDDGDVQGGRNPRVQAMLPPGTYQIFVGSYSPGNNDPYSLGISEMASFTAAQLPPPAGAPAQPGAAPTSAVPMPTGGAPTTTTVQPGFQPDPTVLTGVAGGTMQANQMHNTCRGHVNASPNHVIDASGSFQLLRILVASDQDTTLVVRTPAGTFLCNDDAEGMNPVVEGPFTPGQYQVWVGTYNAGSGATYRLAISEIPSVSTTQGF